MSRTAAPLGMFSSARITASAQLISLDAGGSHERPPYTLERATTASGLSTGSAYRQQRLEPMLVSLGEAPRN